MKLVAVRQGQRRGHRVPDRDQAVTVIADADDFYADVTRYLDEARRIVGRRHAR